jgi:phosphate transport system permease protein
MSPDTTTVPRDVDRALHAPRGPRRGDAVFRILTSGAGTLVLVLIVAIAAFLLAQALPAFHRAGWQFFTTRQWFPDARPARFGVAALAFGTVVASILALAIALPVAVGSALFTTEIAPARIGHWIGHLVDLLAAVPSVVYGLWGFWFLVPRLVPAQRALDNWLGWIPVFHSRNGTYGRSLFTAGVILAIMILPIIAAISREVFRQAPTTHREAAMALGATRWETIRYAVLPFSRGGLIGAAMLGLGRALGETIAVALVLAASYDIKIYLVEPGGNTIAANIATKFGEAGLPGREALIASGVVLFAITLLVNILARVVVYRSNRFVEARA